MEKCFNCGTEHQERNVCPVCGSRAHCWTILSIPNFRYRPIYSGLIITFALHLSPLIVLFILGQITHGNIIIVAAFFIYLIYFIFFRCDNIWCKVWAIQNYYFGSKQEIEYSKAFWNNMTSGTIFIDNAALLRLFDDSYYASNSSRLSFVKPDGKEMCMGTKHIQIILERFIKRNHGKIIISDKQLNFLENQKYAGTASSQQAAQEALSWISSNKNICCLKETGNGEIKPPSEQFLDFLLSEYKNHDHCFLIMLDSFYRKDSGREDELSIKLDSCWDFQNAVSSKKILPIELSDLDCNAVGRSYFLEFPSCEKPGWLPPAPKLVLDELYPDRWWDL